MNATHQAIIKQIRALGQSIEELVVSIPVNQLSKKPDNDSWSIQDIVY